MEATIHGLDLGIWLRDTIPNNGESNGKDNGNDMVTSIIEDTRPQYWRIKWKREGQVMWKLLYV